MKLITEYTETDVQCIVEKKEDGSKTHVIEGVFMQAESKNRNGRIYPKAIMESAVNNGYSFAWGADVSEKGFSFRDGLAIVPADESTIKLRGRDNKHFSDAGAEKIANCFDEPVDEKVITQKMRQNAYDNQTTTDDHGMHITGLVKDQNGDKYFIVKNSWGDDRNDCDGYFYASYPYMRYKTMNIMIHKDAISKDLRKKLGL